MNKTYVIYWKSKVNGRTGTGTAFFEREEAENLAAELNQDYPEIEHEARNTAPPDEVGEPAPLLPAELSSV
ncbi:MAG: hypothetical protein JWR69_1678 [Pedosphaera sp.]|nr:hypothetical protein [Pedosphaera sp.]